MLSSRALSGISNLTPKQHGVSLFQQKSIRLKGILCVYLGGAVLMLHWAGLPLSNLGVCPMSSLPSHPHATQPKPDRLIRASITACCCRTIPHWSKHTHTQSSVLLKGPVLSTMHHKHKMHFNTNVSINKYRGIALNLLVLLLIQWWPKLFEH